MKGLDISAAILLVIGGLNWGLVGLLNFDLVAFAAGDMSILARAIYLLVGTAALYQGLNLRAIQRRWGVAPANA